MNKKTEIFDAFDGKDRDYAPPAVFTQTGTVSQMESSGAYWPEANCDAVKMAKLSTEFSRKYGFATAKIPFCIYMVPEALGCTLNMGTVDSQPACMGSPYSDESAVYETPELPDIKEFLGRGRIPVMLEAARTIAKESEDLFLICGAEDAMSTAQMLLGTENFMMDAMMDPECVKPWIAAAQDYTDLYVSELSEIGDCVQVIASAAMDIMTPEMYFDYTEKSTAKTIAAIDKSLSTIHCCGETMPVLESLASLGEDGLSVETTEDPETISQIVLSNTRLLGGVPPVTHMLSATPDVIKADAKAASDLGYSIIVPECGLPPQTPDCNLLALSRYRD